MGQDFQWPNLLEICHAMEECESTYTGDGDSLDGDHIGNRSKMSCS